MATVTVYNMTTSQKYSDIVVDNNTLGTLKRVLNSNNIGYDGMTFMEASTGTTLNNDDSTFPDNAKIFMTVSDKKIKSGVMDRKEAYRIIKENGWTADVVAATGKNYTNVSTADLDTFIQSRVNTAPAEQTLEEEVAACVAEESGFEQWLNTGIAKGYITKENANKLCSTIKVSAMNDEDMKLFNDLLK